MSPDTNPYPGNMGSPVDRNTSWLLISKPYMPATTLIEGRCLDLQNERQLTPKSPAASFRTASPGEQTTGKLEVVKPYLSKDNLNAVSDSMTPPVPLTQRSDFFDFFGLAAELRDLVYDEALVAQDANYDESGAPRIQVIHGPDKNLLLASRQFNKEYYARAVVHMILDISDHGHCLPANLGQLLLPPIAAGISSLSIDLASEPCSTVPDELRVHEGWVSGVLIQLKALKKLSVRMFCSATEEDDDESIDYEQIICAQAVAELNKPAWSGQNCLHSLELFTAPVNPDVSICIIDDMMKIGSSHKLRAKRSSTTKQMEQVE